MLGRTVQKHRNNLERNQTEEGKILWKCDQNVVRMAERVWNTTGRRREKTRIR